MGHPADFEELQRLPLAGVGEQARLGVGRKLKLLAGAVGKVPEELFEDELFQVVLRVPDDLLRGEERLAVGERRAGGQDQQVGVAQRWEFSQASFVVRIEVDGGAVLVAVRDEGGTDFVEGDAVAALEELRFILRAGVRIGKAKEAALGGLGVEVRKGLQAFH
jgi:hypothetical protein